jgi:uncharacterized protein (TIGR02246 family)
MEGDERRLQAIEDELAVRALAAMFSDTANRRDFAGFAALWAPDGEWVVNDPFPFSARGAENIGATVEKMLGIWELFIQMTHSGVVMLDGDRASARWVVQELARSKDGAQFQNNVAIYDDRLARIDGRWLFTRRSYHYLYFDESTLSGRAFVPPKLTGAGVTD